MKYIKVMCASACSPFPNFSFVRHTVHMQSARIRQVLTDSLLMTVVVFSVLWKGGKSLETTWLLGFVAVVLVFSSLRRIAVPRKVFLSGICFLGFSILSFLFSTAKNYGLDEIIRDAACFLVFIWVSSRCAEAEVLQDFRRKFLRAIVWAAVIAALFGCIIYLFQPVSRFVGSFFDIRFHTDFWPNAWAEFLLLCWPLAVFALRRRPAVLGAVLSLLLGCLLLSYSRAGLLSLLVQLVLLSFLGGIPAIRSRAWPRGETFVHWGKIICISFVGGFLIFMAANETRSRYFPVESFSSKATFTSSEGTSSVSERREFWDAALHMVGEKPLLGWGPYSFRFVQPRYQAAILATSDHPHDLLLKIASERGIPAMIAFVLLLSFILVPATFSVLKGKTKKERDLWVPLALVSVAGVLVHTLVDYNLQFVAIALPFWMLLGMLTPVSNRASFTQRNVLRGLAAALAVVLLWEGVFLATSSFGRHAEIAGDDERALLWYRRSSLEFFSRDLNLSVAGLSLRNSDVEGAYVAVKRALTLNQEDARAWLFLGNVQEEQKDLGNASASYQKAWDLARYDIPNTLSGLLRVKLAMKDADYLTQHGDEFLALFTAYTEAIQHNTHFIALSASVEEIQEQAALLARAYPDEAVNVRTLALRALQHAKQERDRFEQSASGLLW